MVEKDVFFIKYEEIENTYYGKSKLNSEKILLNHSVNGQF